MGVWRAEDLIALQLAEQFRQEVLRLIRASPEAQRAFGWKNQILDASEKTEADITEGFYRNSPRQFAQFLSYARATHAEAERRLKAGIERGFFTRQECEAALRLAIRCGQAILALLKSQKQFF
jgi:four helix bundle protein